MDYSYYSINQIPLVTYGMIAITTGVLVFVSMADNKEEGSSAPAPAPEPEPEAQQEAPPETSEGEEQTGGKRKKKKGSKQKRPKKLSNTKKHR